MKKTELIMIADIIRKWVNCEQDKNYNNKCFRNKASLNFKDFISHVLKSNDNELIKCLYKGKIYRFLHSDNYVSPNKEPKESNLFYSWTKNDTFKKIAKFSEHSMRGITVIEGNTDGEYGIDIVALNQYLSNKFKEIGPILWGGLFDENEVIFPMNKSNIKEVYYCNKYDECEECNKIYVVKNTEAIDGDDIYRCPYCGKITSKKDYCNTYGYHFNSVSFKLEYVNLNKYNKLIV